MTMNGLRRHLRLAVTAWLLFQAVSLSALVPLDCCDAHRSSQAVRRERCHESAESPYCPMRAKSGKACPMHQKAEAEDPHAHHRQASDNDHASHHQGEHEQASATETSRDDCAIGGTCPVPVTALALILSSHGVVPAEVRIPSNADRALLPQHHEEHLTSRQAAPDNPPPRA